MILEMIALFDEFILNIVKYLADKWGYYQNTKWC